MNVLKGIFFSEVNSLVKVQVFWDFMLCHWASSYQLFKWSYCLHRQGQVFFVDYFTLRTKALGSFETPRATHPGTSVTYQKTWVFITLLWETQILHVMWLFWSCPFLPAPNILQKEKKVAMDMKKRNNSLTLDAHLIVLHHFM